MCIWKEPDGAQRQNSEEVEVERRLLKSARWPKRNNRFVCLFLISSYTQWNKAFRAVLMIFQGEDMLAEYTEKKKKKNLKWWGLCFLPRLLAEARPNNSCLWCQRGCFQYGPINISARVWTFKGDGVGFRPVKTHRAAHFWPQHWAEHYLSRHF